ncbi:hypothetical protein TrVFT333_001203 [Trichoderma virens FT-333]|nr:hypothetical protein TrVFT333_001203 [Trichoderma virens FT-333]
MIASTLLCGLQDLSQQHSTLMPQHYRRQRLLLLHSIWSAASDSILGYRPPTGPSDSWTIHGLWPDNCDGSFPQTCDASRAYSNITDILTAMGADDTLHYMQTYWKDYQGHDESFWEHEWGKHGTCITTLDPGCYDDYVPTEEAADFFSRTVSLFKTLPTYQWLADAGITPDGSKSYALEDIQSALSQQHGADVTLGCEGKSLNQVWYHFNVKGSLQDGQFVSTAPDGAKSTCPDSVYYDPKNGVTVMASFGDVDGSADAIMDVFLLLPPGRLFICTFGGPTSGLRVQGRIIVLAAGYCQLVRHQN